MLLYRSWVPCVLCRLCDIVLVSVRSANSMTHQIKHCDICTNRNVDVLTLMPDCKGPTINVL